MSSSTSSGLLVQLKAVIQCAAVWFFLLETEIHFMFFSVKVSFRRIGKGWAILS